MPSIHKGESRKEYVTRATRYIHDNENLDWNQAYAKAIGIWNSHQKKRNKR